MPEEIQQQHSNIIMNNHFVVSSSQTSTKFHHKNIAHIITCPPQAAVRKGSGNSIHSVSFAPSSSAHESGPALMEETSFESPSSSFGSYNGSYGGSGGFLQKNGSPPCRRIPNAIEKRILRRCPQSDLTYRLQV
jgi:hypothetical protein